MITKPPAENFSVGEKKKRVQYGNYVFVHPNPSREVVRAAKNLLLAGVKQLPQLQGKRVFRFRWIIHREWEAKDPVTYKTKIVGIVGWKAWAEDLGYD